MHAGCPTIDSINRSISGVTVQKRLGSGAFGVVHRGVMRIRGVDQFVAIKSYDLKQLNHSMSITARQKFLEKLEEEIMALQALQHESILKLLGQCEDLSYGYRHLVLDYCDGGDLEDAMHKQQTPFSEQQVKEWFYQLLDGLIEMEQKKIIHRDIKPPNILLKRGKAVLADFGLVKHDFRRQAMTVVGTPYSMAPEVDGQKGHNCKADVWSLGVTLYMLLFGRDPWGNWDIVKAQGGRYARKPSQANCGENLFFPSDIKISDPLMRILKRMITWDPDLRISWLEIADSDYFYGKKGNMNSQRKNPTALANQAKPPKIQVKDNNFKEGHQTQQPNLKPTGQPLAAQIAGQYPNGVGHVFHGQVYGQMKVNHQAHFGPQPVAPPVQAAGPTDPQQGLLQAAVHVVKQPATATPEKYFAYLNNCGKFFQETGEALRYCSAKPDVYHHDMWQYLGALGAIVNKINIELLQMAVAQLHTQEQPNGIGTVFAPFYLTSTNLPMLKTKFEERLTKVQRLQTESLDWVQTRFTHPTQTRLVQHLVLGPAFTTSKPANQLANKVAHVLCETAKRLHEQQQLRDDTLFQIKQGLCRIYLCLTYQQAMEFRDQQKEPMDWELFIQRLHDPANIDSVYAKAALHFAQHST